MINYETGEKCKAIPCYEGDRLISRSTPLCWDCVNVFYDWQNLSSKKKEDGFILCFFSFMFLKIIVIITEHFSLILMFASSIIWVQEHFS